MGACRCCHCFSTSLAVWPSTGQPTLTAGNAAASCYRACHRILKLSLPHSQRCRRLPWRKQQAWHCAWRGCYTASCRGRRARRRVGWQQVLQQKCLFEGHLVGVLAEVAVKRPRQQHGIVTLLLGAQAPRKLDRAPPFDTCVVCASCHEHRRVPAVHTLLCPPCRAHLSMLAPAY